MAREEEKVIAVIAGAGEALKFRMQNPGASDEEVMRNITKNAKRISENID
ncbi:MAG: hypothetical protein Q7R52_01085 [archaeon]|nr:hypothetical protein [archaeon]